jgi:hypothetical protein
MHVCLLAPAHYTSKNWIIGDSIMKNMFNILKRTNKYQKRKIKNRLAKELHQMRCYEKALLTGRIQLNDNQLLRFSKLKFDTSRVILNQLREEHGYGGLTVANINTISNRVNSPLKDYTYERTVHKTDKGDRSQSFVDQENSIKKHINTSGLLINGANELCDGVINDVVLRKNEGDGGIPDMVRQQKLNVGGKFPESTDNPGLISGLYKGSVDGTTISNIAGGSILDAPNLHLEGLSEETQRRWQDEKGKFHVGPIVGVRVNQSHIIPSGGEINVTELYEEKFGKGIVDELVRTSDKSISIKENENGYDKMVEMTNELTKFRSSIGVSIDDDVTKDLDKEHEGITREEQQFNNMDEPNRSTIPKRKN